MTIKKKKAHTQSEKFSLKRSQSSVARVFFFFFYMFHLMKVAYFICVSGAPISMPNPVGRRTLICTYKFRQLRKRSVSKKKEKNNNTRYLPYRQLCRRPRTLLHSDTEESTEAESRILIFVHRYLGYIILDSKCMTLTDKAFQTRVLSVCEACRFAKSSLHSVCFICCNSGIRHEGKGRITC